MADDGGERASGASEGPFQGDPWHLLRNRRAMTAAVTAITGESPEIARRRLWREFVLRGSSVRRDARRAGVTRYRFDEAMARFYSETDAFVYELALWNVNLVKRAMRRWVTRWITRALGPGRRVLTWGDGLGFDSVALAEAGHEVTAFDLPGATSAFARALFAAREVPPRAIEDPEQLPEGAFDAVVCLDVLEHVPDVPGELARIRRCLAPGGVLLVHAPFYFVHRVSITHLRANRRYSGSLALFREAGFRLLDAQPTWAPLVWVRADGPGPRRPLLAPLRMALALPFGLVLCLGRLTTLPFEVVNLVCRLGQVWYPDDMLLRGRRRAGAGRTPS